MLIHSFSKCSVGFTKIVLVAFLQNIKYMTLLNSQVMCFGTSFSWNDFFVKLHFTVLIFLMSGQ